MRYILDTCLLIDHADGLRPAVELVARLFEEPNDLFTCDAITAEALSRGTDEHLRSVRSMLGVLEYVATTPDAARWAGESRRRRGQTSHRTLGDALIGSVAWLIGATVITRNPDDFISQEIPVLTY
ncbi:MAG: PIN domain-containing protein [Chloroflexi bacterium]|nr:PIN domain-containing protein [Chloroflexota bacterium]